MIQRKELPVDQLTVDPVQSRDRAWIGDEPDRQLAESINSEGLLQDIIVRRLDASEIAEGNVTNHGSESYPMYAIVAGSRRYHAAMEAGYETIPCKIIEADDLNAAWKSLTENIDRRELSEQEIASQLQLIYELVRPREEPNACPDCGQSVNTEADLLQHCEQTACELPNDPERGLPVAEVEGEETSDGQVTSAAGRFLTEQQALKYLAHRFLGRTDENAINLVEGHLRTAELPPELQSLFKSPDERSSQERTVLDNYGIDTRTRLGSGEGKSGTSREIVKLHEVVATEADTDVVDPTNAVLETVGSLQFDEMSEQELRRTLREFRHEVTAELNEADSAGAQRDRFRETLQRCADNLAETYEEIEPTRPFKKVDVLGPDSQQHSRWHVQVMERRDVSGHGELVRELYQERLETLADQEGWN
jgi:ParB/RepB/Spo0J family partition protein